MSKPANLSELRFRVINLIQGLDRTKKSLIIVVGEDTEGKSQVWADEHSYYKTEHENPTIREAIRSMAIRETPFFEAVDAIRSEWLNPDGSWALENEEAIAV